MLERLCSWNDIWTKTGLFEIPFIRCNTHAQRAKFVVDLFLVYELHPLSKVKNIKTYPWTFNQEQAFNLNQSKGQCGHFMYCMCWNVQGLNIYYMRSVRFPCSHTCQLSSLEMKSEPGKQKRCGVWHWTLCIFRHTEREKVNHLLDV